MRDGKWLWISVLAVAWVVVSCAGMGGGGRDLGDIDSGEDPAEGGISEVPNPSAAMASASGTPIGQLQRGHEIYMLKCGECHNYMLPQNLDVDEWEDAMPKMIRHAGLDSSDESAVLKYVVAVKKQLGE
jgi:hypothetical protein